MKKLILSLLLIAATFQSNGMGYPRSVFSHQRALTHQIVLKKIEMPLPAKAINALNDERYHSIFMKILVEFAITFLKFVD